MGEGVLSAALRECLEGSGLAVAQEPWYVPDPRATGRGWAVTVLATAHLGDVSVLPAVTGMDDAARAALFPAGNSGETAAAVAQDCGGVIFLAHAAMLAGLLDGGPKL